MLSIKVSTSIISPHPKLKDTKKTPHFCEAFDKTCQNLTSYFFAKFNIIPAFAISLIPPICNAIPIT